MLTAFLDFTGEPSISPRNPEELIQGAKHLLPPQVRIFKKKPNQTDSIFKGLDSDEARRFYEGI